MPMQRARREVGGRWGHCGLGGEGTSAAVCVCAACEAIRRTRGSLGTPPGGMGGVCVPALLWGDSILLVRGGKWQAQITITTVECDVGHAGGRGQRVVAGMKGQVCGIIEG